MFIEGIIPNYSEPNSVSKGAAPKDEMGRDTFLTLLVAQLKNQDPLNPMQSTAFTAQLAQFSSLEQLFDINDNLKIMQASEDGQAPENLLDYIGKEIRSADNSLFLINGKASGGNYVLGEKGDVTISIFNEEGLEIKKIYQKGQEPGEYELSFDGKDNYGNPVPDGKYSFEVRAISSEGLPIEVSTGLSGKVTAVTYQAGIPYLIVGGNLIRPESVTEVRLADTL